MENYYTVDEGRDSPKAAAGGQDGGRKDGARKVVVNDSLVIQDRRGKQFLSIDWPKPTGSLAPDDGKNQNERPDYGQRGPRPQEPRSRPKFKLRKGRRGSSNTPTI